VSGIGSLLEIVNKLINAFSGPLFGIFVLAFFSRRAGSVAALVGGSLGALTIYVVACHSPIGFLWPSTFGFATTLVCGAVISVAYPATGHEQWTWRAVMTERHPGAAVPVDVRR
jgi:hypothetical protein